MRLFIVVPLVGTWIEIGDAAANLQGHESCPSWARGLKSQEKLSPLHLVSRAPRGHVD